MSEIGRCLYRAYRRGNKHLTLSILMNDNHLRSDKFVCRDWDSTPLHEACKHGWLDIVQLLIEKYHYNVDVRDKLCGQTPLHLSCQYGRVNVVIYLVEHGCNLTLRDIKGKESVDYALEQDYTYIAYYLCKHGISSAMMLSTDRIKTTVSLLRKMFQDDSHYIEWKTSNGDSILETVCHSKSIAMYMSTKEILSLINNIHSKVIHYGDLIPNLICTDQSCVSCIPSEVMLEWLEDTELDIVKLVTCCDWKTAGGDTLLQLVCQSELCVSRISSTLMMNWLITTHDLMAVIQVPSYKTADGDTLFQLVCQSKSCMSRMSSTMMEILLKRTNVDLIISGLDWTTSQTDDFYISHLWSASVLKWLQKTNLNLERIVVPHWKTADGDTLLQLVCNLKSSVSRISSNVLLKWLTDTSLDLKFIAPNLKTADGDSLFQLVCQSKSCTSRLSLTLLLKWLTDITCYDDLNIDLVVNYKIVNEDTLLQLVCQSESCVSLISSKTMKTWLKSTTIDLYIDNLDWKTSDGVTMIDIISESQPIGKLSYGSPIAVMIVPSWENVDGSSSVQVLYIYKPYISHASSTDMFIWLEKTSLNLERIVPHWKTQDGYSVLELVCQSESCVSRISSTVMLKWLMDTTLDLMKLIVPNYKTAEGNSLLQLVCQSDVCVSRISSNVLLKWLTDIPLDLKFIAPNLKTADGDTLFQLVFQSKSCTSSLSSTLLLEWLTDITCYDDLNIDLVVNYKIVNEDTLLQLVCQSELCVSLISSKTMKTWLKSTTIDLYIDNLDWKTSDGVTMIDIISESQPIGKLSYGSPIAVMIVPSWEDVDGSSSVQVLYIYKPYISHASSTDMFIWLEKTSLNLERIVPHWKTQDGYSVLELVCQSESCVSRISSTVMLKWLMDTTLDLMKLIVPNYKTAEGNSLLQLVCQSDVCVSRISSSEILKWLTDMNLDLMELDLVPNYKTADGCTLLTLICQTESCVSRISSTMLKTWLKQTNVDLLIDSGNNWKTADGNTVISIVHQLSECRPTLMNLCTITIPVEITCIITPNWEVDGKASLLVFYLSELFISQLSSEALLKWLQNMTFDLEKVVIPHWKTVDNKTLLQLVCQSQLCVSRISSMVMLKWLTDTTHNDTVISLTTSKHRTADGDTLLQLVCQSESYLSFTSSTVILKLLIDTTLDLNKLIVPNYTTVDRKTLLHLVCQSESCVARISSIVLLKWLTDTTHNLEELITPNYKTADSDTLLQLVCQSKPCVSGVSSFVMKSWLKNTNVDLLIAHLDWMTANGITLIEITRQLESQPLVHSNFPSCDIPINAIIIPHWPGNYPEKLIRVLFGSAFHTSQLHSTRLLKWLQKTTVDLEKIIVPNWKTADGDTLLQLVYQSKSCVSRVSSTVMEMWLKMTNIDLLITSCLHWMTSDNIQMITVVRKIHKIYVYVGTRSSEIPLHVIITPHWDIGVGNTSLQVLYKTKTYTSQLLSASLLKWLEKTNLNLERIVVPHWKTADGDTLLQLVCQSESCVSRISSKTMKNWLKSINVDLYIDSLDWKTSDNVTMIDIIYLLESQPLGKLSCGTSQCAAVITTNSETVDGSSSRQVIYLSESYVSHLSSTSILKWLEKTTLDLQRIVNVVPHLRTADGDFLLQLICQSESCVSRISSTVMLKWLTTTSLVQKYIKPSSKTADGDTLLRVICQSETCVSSISSAVMQEWLTNTTLDLMKIIVPRYKTAGGDTLLQLVCQSKLCVTRLSSMMLETLLKNTNVDLLIPDLDWKTAEGDTMTQIMHHIMESQQYNFDFNEDLNKAPTDAIITPHWEADDGTIILQVLYRAEQYFSQLSSTSLSKWLQRTNLDIGKIIIPHWKTADGDTLLQLVCKSESCVSHISSTISPSDGLLDLVFHFESLLAKITSQVVFKWFNNKMFALVGNVISCWKTADGTTLFQLFSSSQCFLLHISSALMLQWLNDCGDATFNLMILKSVNPDWTTASGDAILHLLCQSNMKNNNVIELLQYYLQENVLNPNIIDNDGNSAIHLACKADKPAIVTFLMTNTNCDINVRNNTKLLPIEMTKNPEIILYICQCHDIAISTKAVEGWLNDTAVIDKKVIMKIFELLMNNTIKTCDGSTLLHLTCSVVEDIFRDTMSLIHYLLCECHCDPNCLDNNDMMPLQLTSDFRIMKKLVVHGAKVTSDVVFKMITNIAEDKVSEILLLSFTKKLMLWKPSDLNGDGDTALHLACKVDKPAVVKNLLTQWNCNPNEKNSRNEMPIELTTNIDTISLLIEHGATITTELILKFTAIKSIQSHQLAQQIWNPDITNSDGSTALHLACQASLTDTVNFLLSQAHCDPNIKNNNEEVPLQMTTNSDIIKDLIRYGAQTSIMYESHKSALGTNEPIKPPVKMFVVGNPSAGKSTLTAALKKKLNFVVRLFKSGKVSGVEKKTVGIIPHEFESDIFGRVTVYDFAGHREFYSGHAALLKATIQSTPPVFLLVVNLLDRENEIIQNILYWISFLENQCTMVSCKPHIIIVGSHADTLKSKGASPQEKVNALVSILGPNYFINLEFIGFIPMDCQLHESTGMNDLRPLLVRSCSQLRIQEPITFNAHCFLVYLLETFKDTPAVTLSTIHRRIERSHSEGILDFLPKTIGALYKICVELNERGHILFLRDKITIEDSYVVIEEKSLLTEVSGTVFASEDFKQYKHVQLASNTGIVSLSKLASCFPGKDLKILIGLLTHLEFCHEISDQALCQLLSEKYSPDFDERYYLFPGLISGKAKKSIWKSKSNFEYTFGWILRCTKLEQFFSSRFLQVVLLRLAFLLTFELKSSSDSKDLDYLGIHRKCSLWKNGIFWGTHFGMDTLVEIVDNKSVVVMARFKASHLLKCTKQRSQVLQIVLECVQEFCPRLSTVEFFIETSSNSTLKYPFDFSDDSLCTVKDLTEALVINCDNPSVVLSESGKSISAQSFISYEPYAEIEASTLQELFDKNNDNKVVPDVYLAKLVKKISKNLPFLVKIFNEEAHIPCSKDDLYQEILNWRDSSIAEPKTYSQLRNKFDQHSVFAGRNVLVSTIVYS